MISSLLPLNASCSRLQFVSNARIPYVPDLNLPSSPSIALCFSKNLLPFEVFCSSTWLVPFSVLSHCLFSIPDLLSSLIPKIGSSNLMVSLENFRAPFLVPHHCPISPYPQIPPLKFFLLTPSTAYLDSSYNIVY